jgi:UDP-N-acetylglucosamine 1-carboxyvinyltransferase
MAQQFVIQSSAALQGQAHVYGAKNAALVSIASLILTQGKSRLHNVPFSDDIVCMMNLLVSLGASASYNAQEMILEVDTTALADWHVSPEIMRKMRASILVMGPLLVRFGKAVVAQPGGCDLGPRPIDYHLKNFLKMGVAITQDTHFIDAHVTRFTSARIVLEYPSVGATENLMMAAAGAYGVTTSIVNAALEPEVLNLIAILQKMGASITIHAPATIIIEGVAQLRPIEHTIIPDRLEAGSLLIAAAITGGTLHLPQAHAHEMDVFLLKLQEMGHTITVGSQGVGVSIQATKDPQAVSFKTGPYPSFPTDLQAPMMVAQCVANGTSIIEETVFENRLLHVRDLQKMGAAIRVEGTKAIIQGVPKLYGASVTATDIRASCALVLAGLIAQGATIVSGISHWRRGYYNLEEKLTRLGARIMVRETPQEMMLDSIEKQQGIVKLSC